MGTADPDGVPWVVGCDWKAPGVRGAPLHDSRANGARESARAIPVGQRASCGSEAGSLPTV